MLSRPAWSADRARRAAHRVVEHGSPATDTTVAGILVSASLLALATGATAGIVTTPPPYREMDLFAVALVLAQAGALIGMRRQPVVSLAVAGAGYLLADLYRLPPLPADAAILLVLYVGVVKSRGPRRYAATLTVALALGAGEWAVLHHLAVPVGQGLFRLGLAMLILTAAVARRSLTAHAREVRADRARLERSRAEAVRALDRHRAGLLHNLHDVVTHRLTTMVVQADAAQTRLAEPSSPTAASLAAIAASGRAALDELRELLASLQPHAEDPSLHEATVGSTEAAPGAGGPGLADLPALLYLASPPGRPTTIEVQGHPRPLPADTQLAMYRIVQESVTNALRHSGVLPGAVTLRYADGEVQLEIVSGPPAAGTRGTGSSALGRGVTGMQARAAGLGGSLYAGLRADGRYCVLTRLPDRGSF